MNVRLDLPFLAAALYAATTASPVAAPDAVGECGNCHGAPGLGGDAPRLAGLPQGYLAAQIRAYADGSRADDIMTPIARTLDAAATARLSAAYAAMRPSPTAAARPADPAVLAKGETLASRGDWSHAVPPCVSCHGRRGLGVGDAFPPLAGQPAAYLSTQLHAWKAGIRRDDPQGLMQDVAAHLDEDQIAAVAAFYASGPTTGKDR